MSIVRSVCMIAAGAALASCATARSTVARDQPAQEVRFDPSQVVGDLELAKMNDEELFARGTSAYAAGDYRNAARYFDRLAEFFPASVHRRAALYSAGLSHERLDAWELARERFAELSDPAKGTGDALDAAFREAETLYHLARYPEAAAILDVISGREDLPAEKRVEARVQHGVCLLEAGLSQPAEASLRKAVEMWNALGDKREINDYFPAQAEFFLGEIYRLYFEAAVLDPQKGADALASDLEHKAELLLSAQGHYLRCIRIGNGYWATAAGSQIGQLYEHLYNQMVQAPAPPELKTPEEIEVYRQELRNKVRVLITKAINIYEGTLEAAERIGAQNAFVARTRESLKKMKELLLADPAVDQPDPPNASATPSTGSSVR